MIKRLPNLALAAAVAAVLAVIGYWSIFTVYLVYDDEGYVLNSLRNYSEHGGLYEQVYSQYGPFFYNLADGLHRLTGLPFDNDHSRMVTVAVWCATALLCGGLVWRFSRSRTAATAAAGLSFVHLASMTNEPSHPGGLLGLLAAAGTLLGAEAIRRGRARWFALATALVGTAMALTKINVGVFFLLAAVSWMLLNTDRERLARTAGWVVALGCVAVPFGLMQTLWSEPWVREFGLIFSGATLALLAALTASRQPEHGPGSWKRFAGAGLVLTAAVLLLTGLRGTSAAGLLDGILLGPLRHPGVYSFAVTWRPGAGGLALVMLALALFVTARRTAAWRPPLLASLRLVAGLWCLLGMFVSIALLLPGVLSSPRLAAGVLWVAAYVPAMPTFALSYGLSLAWLMAVPLGRGPATPEERGRLWLAWVLVWQSLHAFPVAGSQTAWGTFLWAPLLVLGCHDAIRYWAGRAPRRHQRAVRFAGLAVLLGLAATAVRDTGYVGHERFRQGEPLGLPGAARLRLPDDFTSTLRILTENLSAHSGVLFTYPGMFSFNTWADRPTPTLANATHWFSLLSAEQQAAIIRRLDADPRACLVVERYLVTYLYEQNVIPTGPLHDYLLKAFAPALKLDTYELWVRRGRTIALFSTAALRPGSAPDRRRLELTFAGPAAPVSRVEICQLYPPYTVLQALPVSTAQPWEYTPLTLAGSDAAPPAVLTAPQPLAGPTRLTADLVASPRLGPEANLLVQLRAADGRLLRSLRFAQ